MRFQIIRGVSTPQFSLVLAIYARLNLNQYIGQGKKNGLGILSPPKDYAQSPKFRQNETQVPYQYYTSYIPAYHLFPTGKNATYNRLYGDFPDYAENAENAMNLVTIEYPPF